MTLRTQLQCSGSHIGVKSGKPYGCQKASGHTGKHKCDTGNWVLMWSVVECKRKAEEKG